MAIHDWYMVRYPIHEMSVELIRSIIGKFYLWQKW